MADDRSEGHNRSSWFADIRTKLNQLTSVDLLASLGFSSKRHHPVLSDMATDAPDEDEQHFGDVGGLIVADKLEAGLGHAFQYIPDGYPTWCDKCGQFISGLTEKQAVRCNNCRYTCHAQCQLTVALDCRPTGGGSYGPVEWPDALEEDWRAVSQPTIQPDPVSPIETEMEDGRSTPTGEQLRSAIQQYNNAAGDGLSMTLEDDGVTFHGFIQIHMNFSRPINIVAGQQAPSIYQVLGGEADQQTGLVESGEDRKTLSSFYLPRNTVRVIHTTSRTTTSYMIAALLNKFKVADSPAKFALYERDLEPGQTLRARLARIPEQARPLRMALLRGRPVRFVLQENETGDIGWDAFETPELHNFLKILDIEEGQYVKQIEHRYYVYKYWLQAEIRDRLTGAP